MLSGLYYPFSRCIDSAALKQLLLVFDNITFIEPVDDDQWRARLFRDLEQVEDQRFNSYRDLERPFQTLKDEGVISLKHPSELHALTNQDTTSSAVSDLLDPIWSDLASRPHKFNLPHQVRTADGRPTWQVFPDKLPPHFIEALNTDPVLRRHLVWSGDFNHAWTLSYEAGSAAALNLHLAAAGELSLAPITDSEMHHRLLLRKVTRSLTPESEWAQPTSMSVQAVTNRVAVQLIEELVPRNTLRELSFESILRFREETRKERAAMVRDLRARLSSIAKSNSYSEIFAQEQEVTQSIMKEIREYRSGLEYARNKLWPSLLKGSSSAIASGSVAAVAVGYLVGGPMAVLAGSITGASIALAHAALELRAETGKVQSTVEFAPAYLSRVADL